MVALREFTSSGDRVGAGGGCEATVTGRCGWFKFRECGKLLCGKKIALGLKGAVTAEGGCSQELRDTSSTREKYVA